MPNKEPLLLSFNVSDLLALPGAMQALLRLEARADITPGTMELSNQHGEVLRFALDGRLISVKRAEEGNWMAAGPTPIEARLKAMGLKTIDVEIVDALAGEEG